MSEIRDHDHDLPWATNLGRMAVHSPHRLESVTLDGEAWGVQTQTEFDDPVYSVAVDLPPGTTRTVVLELRSAVPAWPYRLTVLPQPTANPDTMTVRIDGASDLGPAPQLSGPLGPVVELGPNDNPAR